VLAVLREGIATAERTTFVARLIQKATCELVLPHSSKNGIHPFLNRYNRSKAPRRKGRFSLRPDMIRLLGLQVYADIEIQFIDIRPGKRLHEELRLIRLKRTR
jgi:hypothetical protein